MLKRHPTVFRLIYYLGMGIAWSPLVLRMCIAKLLFVFFALIPSRRRKIVENNIKMFFPHLPLSRIIIMKYACVYNILHAFVDILTVWFRGVEWADKRIIHVHNPHIIPELAEQGKPVIFLSPHIGNWEILVSYIGRTHSCLSLYKQIPNKYYDNLTKRFRESINAKVVSVDSPSDLRGMLKSLKKGEYAGLTFLPDQRPQWGTTPATAELLGVKLSISVFIAKVIQTLDCNVVFVYAIRRAWGKYEIFVDTPGENIYSKDSNLAIQEVMNGVEKAIKRAPTQYNWLQRKETKSS